MERAGHTRIRDRRSRVRATARSQCGVKPRQGCAGRMHRERCSDALSKRPNDVGTEGWNERQQHSAAVCSDSGVGTVKVRLLRRSRG